jgi:hypothetical protein
MLAIRECHSRTNPVTGEEGSAANCAKSRLIVYSKLLCFAYRTVGWAQQSGKQPASFRGDTMQIRNSRRSQLAMAISATLASLGAGSISHAQAQDQSLQLEEIIVTARKTEESLQDVPIAITAFTAQALEEAGIESVVDIAAQTPGFSFNQGFGRSGGGSADASSRPSIRGMSSILGTANASSSWTASSCRATPPATSSTTSSASR